MTSHRKAVRQGSRSRKTQGSDAERAGGRGSAAREHVMRILSTTRRRVLALAGAVGVITGAITGVLALLPKSPEALSAHFEGVTATPEVSLEQYDTRAAPSIVGAARTASAALSPYRLAADTRTVATTAGEGPEPGQTATSTATSTSTTSPSQSVEPTGTQTGTQTGTPATTPTSTTGPQTTATTQPRRRIRGHPSGRRVTHTGAKRRGGEITLGSASVPYPQEQQAPSPQQAAAAPPAQAPHAVTGAVVSEGAGVPHRSVAAVAALLTGRPAEPVSGATPAPEAQATTPGTGPATSAAPTESAAPQPAAPAHLRRAAGGRAPQLVLPAGCLSRTCGATQEIEQALTYDPNPAKAAEAVAAIFNDSRAEIVGRNLYPLGAEVTYNVTLKGFAHSTATLGWSLVGKADKRPLARPWWRNIIVAHVTPTVEEESLDGSFWVPMPPEHGDYLVKLYLLDSGGVPHAISYSSPAFH
jgi:hypothetical protein